MQYPNSFNSASTRAALQGACTEVHALALHSYEVAKQDTSASGAMQLAKAVRDLSRRERPTQWRALVLYITAPSPTSLHQALDSVNTACPLPVFITAARYARSLSDLTRHKMTLPTGHEQSIEWQTLSDACHVPGLSRAYQVASTKLIKGEGQNSVGSIDEELAALGEQKAARDARIDSCSFDAAQLGLRTKAITATSARSLADALERLGDNHTHWAFQVYVGRQQAIAPLVELFN
ncbi:hypothetical protein MHM95_12305 [Pseudoalteromonas sp. CnMc7-15]|uniref:hypothetical protein n=1 Tax=unclassified Pseudoalteromonas TaxID=194690 RepID=UPI001EF56709|nr:hypothetical protein [Pseudoalteromonas sp. CnMc7-15]MCG7567062.1 hypothetical protein [Pseudoalteromonas sp. CnMc7-15]